MKGFSGFGVSPVKQNREREPKQIEPKKPKRTNFNVSNPPPKPSGNGGTLRPISGFEFDFPKTTSFFHLIKITTDISHFCVV